MKAIIAKEAWEFLKENSNAVLIDVRTKEEWTSVGCPDLRSLGKKTYGSSWYYGDEKAFIEKLKKHIPDKNTPILFICRAGGRSHGAASLAETHGYTDITNISDGFEDKNGPGTGWREGGIPYFFPYKT